MFTGSARVVTVLYPAAGDQAGIKQVDASSAENEFTLHMTDGRIVTVTE